MLPAAVGPLPSQQPGEQETKWEMALPKLATLAGFFPPTPGARRHKPREASPRVLNMPNAVFSPRKAEPSLFLPFQNSTENKLECYAQLQ